MRGWRRRRGLVGAMTPSPVASDGLRAGVLDWLRANPGVSTEAVVEAVARRKQTVVALLEQLRAEEVIVVDLLRLSGAALAATDETSFTAGCGRSKG